MVEPLDSLTVALAGTVLELSRSTSWAPYASLNFSTPLLENERWLALSSCCLSKLAARYTL